MKLPTTTSENVTSLKQQPLWTKPSKSNTLSKRYLPRATISLNETSIEKVSLKRHFLEQQPHYNNSSLKHHLPKRLSLFTSNLSKQCLPTATTSFERHICFYIGQLCRPLTIYTKQSIQHTHFCVPNDDRACYYYQSLTLNWMNANVILAYVSILD